MRRPAFIGLMVCLFVAAAAIGLTWTVQASRIKSAVENVVAELNSAGQVKLTYDALETSGFPTEVVVSMVNPRFTGRLDTLFSQAQQAQKHPLPEWNEDLTLTGTLMLGVNAMSDRYMLGMQGQWKNRSVIGNETIAMESSPDGVMRCTLEINRAGGWFGSLWDFKTLTEHGKEIANDFRLADCMASQNAIVLQDGKTLIMKNGPERLYISHNIEKARRQVRVFFSLADLEVSPEGDKIFGLYSGAIAPWYDTAPLFSAYGKQNTEVDFTYNGPAEWTASPKETPLDIHLSKFVINNDAYQINATFDLTNGDIGAQHEARVALKAESIYTDIYDVLMQDMVRSLVKQMFLEPNPPPQLKTVLAQHTPESLYALVNPALPDFHALGRLAMALDLGYLGNREFTAGDVTLAALELSAAPYGITGLGTGKLTAGNPIPAVNLTLTCRSCLRMVDDMAGYARRLQKVAAAFEPEKAPKAIEQKTVDGYKAFLQVLAGKNINGENFTYAILGDGSGITINNNRMDEVMRLYRLHVPRDRATEPVQ